MAAVLHQHRERDLRVVRGRVGDEQRVVAVALLHPLLVVLLARFMPITCAVPVLPATQVRRALRERARAGAARACHVDHGGP